MDKCPVCNKDVNNKDCNGVIDGVIYYFCCKQCENNFEAEPRKFINCCEQKQEE